MKPLRLFKGPLFPHRNTKPSRSLNASAPIARGVIDESDFLNRPRLNQFWDYIEAGRPTRKDLEAQREGKESIDNP